MAEFVEPGAYYLLDLTDAEGKTLAVVNTHTIEVPPAGSKEEPYNLGTITLESPAGELNIGDSASWILPSPRWMVGRSSSPIFGAGTGLLDFWATWCGPCVAEIPNVAAIYDQFGHDPRFAIIGLSLDPERSKLASFVEKRNLLWPQGFLGNLIEDPVTRKYGITAIPAVFLIGPDGRIIQRGLSGPQIKEAVEAVLKDDALKARTSLNVENATMFPGNILVAKANLAATIRYVTDQGPRALNAGDHLAQGATIVTGNSGDGRVVLAFSNGAVLYLMPDTIMRIDRFQQAPSFPKPFASDAESC